mgnify:CR=1 FL=1
MIFYNAGEFTHKDMTVKVDKGCALIIKKIDKVDKKEIIKYMDAYRKVYDFA